jgi:hypothetical protein
VTVTMFELLVSIESSYCPTYTYDSRISSASSPGTRDVRGQEAGAAVWVPLMARTDVATDTAASGAC